MILKTFVMVGEMNRYLIAAVDRIGALPTAASFWTLGILFQELMKASSSPLIFRCSISTRCKNS